MIPTHLILQYKFEDLMVHDYHRVLSITADNKKRSTSYLDKLFGHEANLFALGSFGIERIVTRKGNYSRISSSVEMRRLAKGYYHEEPMVTLEYHLQ